MSTLSYAVADSATLLRRNLKHILRYPTTAIAVAGIPIIFLLLFVYVFGGALGTSIGGTGGGRADYVNYVVPGLVAMVAATGSLGTSTSVSVDMTEGIITRFRTMAIFRPAILIARVIASMIQTMVSMALVLGVALLMGFRPPAGFGGWLGAIGLLALVTFAFTWIAVAFGLAAKTLDAASNAPFPLILLPFVGSGIVPTASMAPGIREFAEYQPFTPIIETLRGLLMGTPIGSNGIIAVAWSVGITVVGYVWAKKAFARDRAQPQ
ncbi:ABC transporter permease [Amycolatopsis sp. MEPSY49]|uniref:ABC transporter permease n=1 Tax=Amycolatopsis sp. MEPSY49 TaxID=3151600 RepID=UPI003EFA0A2B